MSKIGSSEKSFESFFLVTIMKNYGVVIKNSFSNCDCNFLCFLRKSI
uniref:Uncharacterized protein n=1 Tax=viral metagenome TaxID=1070528 RepID=A0A6C0E0X2_9ZZZZ